MNSIRRIRIDYISALRHNLRSGWLVHADSVHEQNEKMPPLHFYWFVYAGCSRNCPAQHVVPAGLRYADITRCASLPCLRVSAISASLCCLDGPLIDGWLASLPEDVLQGQQRLLQGGNVKRFMLKLTNPKRLERPCAWAWSTTLTRAWLY